MKNIPDLHFYRVPRDKAFKETVCLWGDDTPNLSEGAIFSVSMTLDRAFITGRNWFLSSSVMKFLLGTESAPESKFLKISNPQNSKISLFLS